MQNWGTCYFLQHSYERKCCMEENNSALKKIFIYIYICLKSFPISGIAKLLQSIPISIVFCDYVRYLLKSCLCSICRDPKLVPHIAPSPPPPTMMGDYQTS